MEKILRFFIDVVISAAVLVADYYFFPSQNLFFSVGIFVAVLFILSVIKSPISKNSDTIISNKE
ncbi:MAG: hypothetical protein JWN90_113 [Parcubacteria group bacterium]|nr:hypothetical protein [Parcubacteria group bacterium]